MAVLMFIFATSKRELGISKMMGFGVDSQHHRLLSNSSTRYLRTVNCQAFNSP